MLNFNIDVGRALKLLGGADIGARISAITHERASQMQLMSPRFTYRVIPVGELPLRGNDIKKHLKDCPFAVLSAGTMGVQFDYLMNRLQSTDMTEAVITDALGSVAVEQLCNHMVESEVLPALKQRFGNGVKLTKLHYSPGYGDYDLSENKTVINLLQADKRIGLTVLASNMLTPVKSVTRVTGIYES